jgi:acyl-CoA thioester hydrolase
MPPAGAQIKETIFRVRFAETDLMGIVHHASYVIYLEEARVDFTRQIGAPYSDLEAAGYSLAVSELNIRYVAPARFDQQIVVKTWLEEVRSRTVTFGYEVFELESQILLVTARVKLICVDRAGQIKRIPPAWLSILEPMAKGK